MKKIYAICPRCDYELTLENSQFSAEPCDSDEYIAKMLMEYHLNASPECRSLANDEIIEDLALVIEKIEFSDRLDKKALSESLREICRTLTDCTCVCTYAKTCDIACDKVLSK